MILLRCYLLAGLIVHKVVWELLKRRQSPVSSEQHSAQSLGLKFVKAVKIGILLGIIVQTLVRDVLPITDAPFIIRFVGVLIYSLGLVLAISARIQLGSNWTNIETAQVLSGQEVVSKGIYRYIRHPIYVGDLLLLFGFELSLNSWFVVAVALMTPVVLRKALHEEKILIGNLPDYANYCKNTKRFVPFLF
jgi:protein-S-isoprenylcysteine O-methyltransferase Ste14